MKTTVLQTTLIFTLLLGGICLNAQVTETDKSMFWATASTGTKLSKKVSLSYEQLHSYDLTKGRINFIQPSLGVHYKPSKKWQLSFNYIPTISIDENPNNQLLYHRVRVRARHYTRVNKRFRMYNSINAEHNFNQFSKYQQRIYLRNDFYYRNNSLPWRLRPFIEQRLYWYQGGRDLQYYSEDGAKLEKVAPNGLHAYRGKIGVKLYPIKNLNFSLYLLKQEEFNTSLFGAKDINSPNRKKNKIRRKYYDYTVFGLSATYRF